MPLCCGSLSNLQEELGVPALEALKFAGNVDDPPTWCGAAWTIFVRGTWRPPSFVEKLLSGTSCNNLSECYNNVDVGVPLWLTEQWDKHPRQEFAISYPALYASA